MYTVRPEQPRDLDAIHEVNRLAFGQLNEAELIALLRRSPDYIPQLSLVAEFEARVVGHILFSAIVIQTPAQPVPALALAPMAVDPEFQRQGIGSALVRAGLDACRRLGHKCVIVLGHAEYYPRFGFVPAAPKGIRPPLEVPEDVFMLLELAPGALAGVQGTVEYPPAFDSV